VGRRVLCSIISACGDVIIRLIEGIRSIGWRRDRKWKIGLCNDVFYCFLMILIYLFVDRAYKNHLLNKLSNLIEFNLLILALPAPTLANPNVKPSGLPHLKYIFQL